MASYRIKKNAKDDSNGTNITKNDIRRCEEEKIIKRSSVSVYMSSV